MWLCRCIHTCKGTVIITGGGYDAAARQADERNKSVYLKIVNRILNA